MSAPAAAAGSTSSDSKASSAAAVATPTPVVSNNSNNNSNNNNQHTPVVQDTTLLGPFEDKHDKEEKPQSIIMHLVKSLSAGQDLTKVLIPTFFLEPRSLLEKYTDLWAHPQYILNVASIEDPLERMLSVVRWYVSGWHIKPKLCKKPYNPILGEEFFAYWDHGDSRTDFYAEQVSHHPPVSAIYIENRKKNITINAHIYAKSKFLGNSAACESVGDAVLSLNNLQEEYLMTFPTYYACGLFFGSLRMEIGDKKSIVCHKTGLSAEIEFRTSSLFDGEINRLRGKIFRHSDPKKPVLYTFEGRWDGLVKLVDKRTHKEAILFELAKSPAQFKYVTALEHQTPFESRKAWEGVSRALQKQDHDNATRAKETLENAQRLAKIDRDKKGIVYQQKMFHKFKQGWRFNNTDTTPYDAKEPAKPLPTDYHRLKKEKAAHVQDRKDEKKDHPPAAAATSAAAPASVAKK